MTTRSKLTVVASLIAAAFISIPCAYAEAFEENFPAVDTEVVAIDLADLEKAFWIATTKPRPTASELSTRKPAQ